jgi:hypothetical protein
MRDPQARLTKWEDFVLVCRGFVPPRAPGCDRSLPGFSRSIGGFWV